MSMTERNGEGMLYEEEVQPYRKMDYKPIIYKYIVDSHEMRAKCAKNTSFDAFCVFISKKYTFEKKKS